MSDIVERLLGEKALHAELDRKADGADLVDHKGKSYRRSGPKDQSSQPGKWREVKKKKVKESEFPGNPISQKVDELEQVVERIAGLVNRSSGYQLNGRLTAYLDSALNELRDVAEFLDSEIGHETPSSSQGGQVRVPDLIHPRDDHPPASS
jgi:hypothetical protein